jgi:hypothetical protein
MVMAQTDSADIAINKCQAGELTSAREIIDAISISPTYKNDPRTFVYKGYIYKELSKKEQNQAWELRKQAITFLNQATELDKNNEYQNDIKQQLKYLLSLFYNQSINILNGDNLKQSEEFFSVYLNNFHKVDSTFNKKQKQIEFLLGAATKLTQEYNADWKNKTPLIEKIEELYQQVLQLDPNNYTANYNMGMLFYNHAVHLINDMDYDLDLIALNEIEDKTIALFKKALPYEHAAEKIMPNRRETLMALQGIYFSLNDFEKSNYYKDLLDKLNK